MSGKHDNGDKSKNYSIRPSPLRRCRESLTTSAARCRGPGLRPLQSRTAPKVWRPVEPLTPSNSAMGGRSGRDPACGCARSQSKPGASGLPVGPDGGRTVYRAAARGGNQRMVQPQPRAHHAGLASGRLCRLQPGPGPGPGEFRPAGGVYGVCRARAPQRAARARLSGARGAPAPKLSLAPPWTGRNPDRDLDRECRPLGPFGHGLARRARSPIAALSADAAGGSHYARGGVRRRLGENLASPRAQGTAQGAAAPRHRRRGGARRVFHRLRIRGSAARIRRVHVRRGRDPARGRAAGIAPPRLPRRIDEPAEPPRARGASHGAGTDVCDRHDRRGSFQVVQRHPRSPYRRPGTEAGRRPPRGDRGRWHVVSLRRRGVLRSVLRAHARSGVAASGAAAQGHRELQNGGARREPAQGEGDWIASSRNARSGKDAVGDGEHRRSRARRYAHQAGAGHPRSGRSPLSRQARRAKPGHAVARAIAGRSTMPARMRQSARPRHKGNDRVTQRRASEGPGENEARFRAIAELSGDWYWEQDASYRFTWAFVRGGSAEEISWIIGKTRWELGEQPLNGTWEEHRRLLDARQPFRDFHLRIVDRTGEEHFFSTTGVPIFDPAGIFTGYRGLARRITKITKRKRADELLRLEHTVARAVTEADSVAAALKAVIRTVCEAQDWECGRFFRVDDEAGALHFAEFWSKPG